MTVYNDQQLATFFRSAGFPDSVISTAIAVVHGESGADTNAINPNDPYGGSFGLWQINGAHIIGLSGNAVSLSCAQDAQCSSNFAYTLWQKQGFTPWGAFTNGSYKQFLSGQSSTTPSSTTRTAAFGLPDLSGLFAWAGSPMRLMKMAAGLMLIALALILFIAPDTPEKIADYIKIGALAA